MTETATSSTVEISDIQSLVGRRMGPAAPVKLTQERINLFATATGDKQWIHTDPDRAANTATGSTIAHGFLILSLAATVNQKLISIKGTASRVNYGLNKVRFVAPAPVNTTVRGYTTLHSVEDARAGTRLIFDIELCGDGIDKPLCVAQFISLAPGIHLEQGDQS